MISLLHLTPIQDTARVLRLKAQQYLTAIGEDRITKYVEPRPLLPRIEQYLKRLPKSEASHFLDLLAADILLVANSYSGQRRNIAVMDLDEVYRSLDIEPSDHVRRFFMNHVLREVTAEPAYETRQGRFSPKNKGSEKRVKEPAAA